MIAGGDQGIYDSTDGGATWTCITPGLGVSIRYALAVHGDDRLTSVQDFSAMQSFDGGRTWLQLSGAHPPAGEDGDVVIDPRNPSDQYLFNSASACGERG